MQRLSPDEYRDVAKTPLVAVLDNVRSMHNVGSVFRTADSFRMEKIFLCGISNTPPNAEIHKTALGAELSVEWEYFADTHKVIEILKAQNYTVLAVEQAHGSTMLNEFNINTTNKYALIFGNEVHGIQQSVVDLCDGCIEIPQLGTKHSLNVSVSAGIVIWEFAKQLITL